MSWGRPGGLAASPGRPPRTDRGQTIQALNRGASTHRRAGRAVSALPANNYPQSHGPVFPVRPQAEVVDLAGRRSATRETPPPPDRNRDEPAQDVTPDSGPHSGPGMTLGDIPGDFDSVRAVWTGTPEPLSVLAEKVRAARGPEDP